MGNDTILDRIMARKREEVTEKKGRIRESELLERGRQYPSRDFVAALARKCDTGSAIIAEIKRGSPSRGIIHQGTGPFEPARIAEGYQQHGAACLSCLTDRDFFHASDDFLPAVRARADIPVLRKDFLYDPWQVLESRALGADAVLLILAVLSPGQAQELESAAHELGLAVLIEVHDEAEMERAHDLRSPLIGINNRDLRTFTTTLETSARLARIADPARRLVSESGIHTAADLHWLRGHGICAFLIGESFMREPDPGQALARLLSEDAHVE